MVALRIKAQSAADPTLVDLPWDQPLETWPDEGFVRLPEGIHRHVVRFLDHNGRYLALKELPARLAERERTMLTQLGDLGLPAVTFVGVASERTTADGAPLDDILLTRHLGYSLPFRYLFSGPSSLEQRDRMLNALVVLLVRLHLAGFFWGDCSLNNALFRRDAGSLRSYVVDTETSEMHPALSDGQRRLDLDIAAENVVGGLLDLDAGGRLAGGIDPSAAAARLRDQYQSLWHELTAEDEVPSTELWRIHDRLARLNELGFDADEYELEAARPAGMVRFRPTVVEEGHHKRRLMQLTGIDAHENQARRLLGAMNSYGAWLSEREGREFPEAVVAYRWLTERWEYALGRIPSELRDRLEDAEIYHEILDHFFALSRDAGSDVSMEVCIAHYVESNLATRPDERQLLEADVVDDPSPE